MTHFSVGEEAANVGAMLALNPDDLNHIKQPVVTDKLLPKGI